jgi:hypothetical protein
MLPPQPAPWQPVLAQQPEQALRPSRARQAALMAQAIRVRLLRPELERRAA